MITLTLHKVCDVLPLLTWKQNFDRLSPNYLCNRAPWTWFDAPKTVETIHLIGHTDGPADKYTYPVEIWNDNLYIQLKNGTWKRTDTFLALRLWITENNITRIGLEYDA